jgi:hypothetical protein
METGMQATWKPYEKLGELTERSDLPDSVFAFPKQRKAPLTDANHVRNAIARFDQTVGVSDADRDLAFANIKKAARLGIPLRVGIVATTETQRVEEARQELKALGVKRINVDHVRPFGRGAQSQSPDASGLCGRCGAGRAAVGPDGKVSPCVFSAGMMDVGDVRESPLGTILNSTSMAEARGHIRSVIVTHDGGDDDDSGGRGSDDCDPVGDGECSPGYPSSSCSPRS